MTISKYVTDFLAQNELVEIDTNHIRDGSDRYGLFKSPARQLKEFNDGSYEITEQYQLLARQPSMADEERAESEEWFERLVYWLDDYAFLYDYPPLDGNREVLNISVSGSPYPMEADDQESMYQLILSITYRREREV